MACGCGTVMQAGPGGAFRSGALGAAFEQMPEYQLCLRKAAHQPRAQQSAFKQRCAEYWSAKYASRPRLRRPVRGTSGLGALATLDSDMILGLLLGGGGLWLLLR